MNFQYAKSMSGTFPCIEKIHALFQQGELTPSDVLQSCCAQIDRREPDLRAWVSVDRVGAELLAREQTAWLVGEGRGQPLPPLFGIPLGIKDIIDVAHWPTLAGSRLRGDDVLHYIAPHDSAAVSHLRAAGAIILGKTVTTEFACFDPATTRNPWNLAHTPGGSSSGSAAAVAAGMCVAALGTQTGGSLLRPAAFCGIVGFKPSFGAVDTAGVVPVSHSLDHVGPLTSSVADARRLFGVLSGRSVESAPSGEQVRLATISSFFQEKGLAEAQRVVQQVLQRLGVTEVLEPPVAIADMHSVHRAIMAHECAEYHRSTIAQHRSQYSPGVVSLVEEGLRQTMAEYAQVQASAKHIRSTWQRVWEKVDAILLPTTAGAAPATLQTTGDPRWQSPWSLLGWPAISLPCGLTASGMPLGLQIVARDDAFLLSLAARVEQQLSFDHRPTFRHVSSLDVTL
jgi:aspartyl-tRNA(Asn)/glutamyl-tRNA(Gln) amidotransferase subunit A